MKTPITLTLAGVLAASTALPAAAQYYQPTQEYRQQLQEYRQDQRDYAARRADYERARRDYERRLADYNRARARYDARYGYGAYARRYGPAPTWDTTYWDRYGYNDGYYANNTAPYAGYYGSNASYADPCRNQRSGNQTAGGLLGALAGAAIGSNVAARNARTEGAVLGALVGGAIGANIAGSATKARCDDRGLYYSYNDTIAYRESDWDRRGRSGRYDYSYYENQRCRLAPAPVDADRDGDVEYRYVRVCPDSQGRYRVTG